VLDLVDQSVVVLDAAGRVVLANQAAGTILGFSRAQDLGREVAGLNDGFEVFDLAGNLLGPEARPSAKVLRGDEVRDQVVERRRRSDGRVQYLSTSGGPLRADDGEQLTVLVTKDVTAQHQAEKSRQETETAFRAIFDHAALGMAEVEAQSGRFLRANRALCELLGCSAADLTARTWIELTHPDHRDADLAAAAEAMAACAPFQREKRFLRKDGSEVWCRVSVSPQWSKGGQPGTNVVVVEDFTRKRALRQAERESSERLSAVLQLAPSGFIVVRVSDRKILDANDAWPRLLGFTREEVLGQTTSSLGIYRFPEEYQRIAEESQATGGLGLMEVHLRKKSGEPGVFLMSAAPGTVAGEKVFIGALHDITALKRAAQAREESEERFRALIEKSTDMTILLGRDLRTTFWSPSASAQLGWTPQELGSRGLTGLVHGDDRLAFEAALAEACSAPGTTASIKARARHRDGSFRHLTGSCRNLLEDAAVRALVVNVRDDTAERSLAQQLLQSQKLESIGRLAGGVAHDFNNLLTVIMSCAEQLEGELRSGGRASLDDVVEVLQAGARAGDLTRQLLSFARRQAVTPVPLSLDAVVQGSEKLLRRVLGEDVKLVVRTAAGWPIFADRGQVDQVLVNLAVNAHDAMPGGGTLTIETGVADESAQGNGQWVVLRVTDTGAGMSPEVQARIFEPFFTTKVPGKGTGLGLATVHGIVAQCEGTIRVESEPGRGTAFELRFPRTLLEPGPASASTPVTLRGTETLLLVEDDPQVRGVTTRALERAGYTVLAAASGADAVARAAAHLDRLDLVICDVVLGGMSGRAAVDELRAARPGLRALFISGYAHDTVSQRGVTDSGAEFLSKPFTPNVLLARLRELFGATQQ
jgi:PAS domain S-box-containing protein